MDHLPHMQDTIATLSAKGAHRRAVSSEGDLERIAELSRLSPFVSGRGDRTTGDHKRYDTQGENAAPRADWAP